MYSTGKAERLLRSSPANVIFYSDELLEELLPRVSETQQITCIAELFRRRFLNRKNSRIAETIDRCLPDGERSNLERLLDQDFLCNPSAEVLAGSFWKAARPFSERCQTAVRSRLYSLCTGTDGFIPVYSNEKAWFIPFHFEEGKCEIRDAAGKIISAWQEYYQALFGEKGGYSCVAHFDSSNIPGDLGGSSLMLPLYLAFLRKKGRIFYNHLRLLATGSIADAVIAPVEVKEKSAAVEKCFGDAVFIFPESTCYASEKRHEIPLFGRLSLTELEEKIKEIIEAGGLWTPTFKDAVRRLEKLAEECESNFSKWQTMLDRLENNAKVIPEYREPEKYLLCLMLHSAICCHMGNTEEALKYNEEARKFASENSLELQLRRLEIEELVELQDKEKFDALLPLAEKLHGNIEKLAEPDLLMRYFGTMGQGHAYGVLSGKKGFDQKTALEYLKKAVQYACQIDSEPDIAQDLNYLVLWHALFAPESPGLKKSYQKAVEQMKNLSGNFAVQNKFFLKRNRAFSLYRYYLETKTLPDHDYEEFLLPDQAEEWLQAVTDKYIGTLHAAAGKTAEAEKLFEHGNKLLESFGYPIFKLLRLTVLCQAFESLRKEKFRTEARRLVSELKECAEPPETLGLWQTYLEDKGDFPGLKYWY